MEQCTINGCDKPLRSKGYCLMHYTRLRRHNDVGAVTPYRGKNKVCSVDHCSSLHTGLGLCKRHYDQLRSYGRVLKHTVKDPRPAIIEGDTAKLPLGVGAKQGYAIIDKDDVHLDKYYWRMNADGYAHALIDRKTVQLQRLIMNAPTGTEVDHKDHNPLNNRKTNLRIATRAQNQWNSKVKRTSTTGLKGVSPRPNGTYVARITANGNRIQLGYFKTAELAHAAYNKAALKYHGEFVYNTTRGLAT